MRKITPELINALIDVVKTRADETLSRSELDKLTALKSQLENLPKIEEKSKSLRDQYIDALNDPNYQKALDRYKSYRELDFIRGNFS